ncbi:hypothetical protein [Luteimonas panaciterrae]|uniref:hypothetical protein n=1 Tax=Luteimonas panaciterrae TaxID=363885 RepID=UPI001CFBA093|nr:hypothetical protein [Luteimonas panaciterrae]
MYKHIFLLLLLFYSSGAIASGCKELPRQSRYSTSTVLLSDTQNPSPGQQIKLTASISTGNFFAVECIYPQTDIGGYVKFYLGDNVVESVRITSWNTPPEFLFSFNPCGGSGCSDFSYFGANEALISIYYTVPLSQNPLTFRAQFSGDDYFSGESWSGPVEINPGPPKPPAPSPPTSSPVIGHTYTISWLPVANAETYSLDRIDQYGERQAMIYYGPSTSWTEVNMASGVYRYTVMACPSSGDCSAPSAESAPVVVAPDITPIITPYITR